MYNEFSKGQLESHPHNKDYIGQLDLQTLPTINTPKDNWNNTPYSADSKGQLEEHSLQ